jgi:hypothetical protein
VNTYPPLPDAPSFGRKSPLSEENGGVMGVLERRFPSIAHPPAGIAVGATPCCACTGFGEYITNPNVRKTASPGNKILCAQRLNTIVKFSILYNFIIIIQPTRKGDKAYKALKKRQYTIKKVACQIEKLIHRPVKKKEDMQNPAIMPGFDEKNKKEKLDCKLFK